MFYPAGAGVTVEAVNSVAAASVGMCCAGLNGLACFDGDFFSVTRLSII